MMQSSQSTMIQYEFQNQYLLLWSFLKITFQPNYKYNYNYNTIINTTCQLNNTLKNLFFGQSSVGRIVVREGPLGPRYGFV